MAIQNNGGNIIVQNSNKDVVGSFNIEGSVDFNSAVQCLRDSGMNPRDVKDMAGGYGENTVVVDGESAAVLDVRTKIHGCAVGE